MVDKTLSYIAKLKLNGIKLETEIQNDTLCLTDVQLSDPDMRIELNLSNIENGNVIINRLMRINLFSRYYYSNSDAQILLNVDNLNFEIQSNEVLIDIMNNIKQGDITSSDILVYSDFMLSDEAWDRFDRAVYNRYEYLKDEKDIQVKDYADFIDLSCQQLEFISHASYIKLVEQSKLKIMNGYETYAPGIKSIVKELQNLKLALSLGRNDYYRLSGPELFEIYEELHTLVKSHTNALEFDIDKKDNNVKLGYTKAFKSKVSLLLEHIEHYKTYELK
jgi:hypothetical protein